MQKTWDLLTSTGLMTVRRRLAGLLSGTLLLALLPSFVSELLQPERHRKPVKLHSTSYLDGLRGLAACIVFVYHYTDYNHKSLLPMYGRNAPGEGSSFLQLPYVRLIYSGKPMVHIFFVISGFALAYRPLQYLYEQRSQDACSFVQRRRSAGIAKCHAALASSAFRRPIRLFGPPLVLTFADMILVRFGYLYNVVRPQLTFWKQLREWVGDALEKVIWPWGWDDKSYHSMYNPHLWTIPVEFTHSMLLFFVLLAVSRLRTSGLRRTALLLCMAYMFLLCARWAGFEFLAGALLADFHIGAEHARKAEYHLSRQGLGGGDEHPRRPSALLSRIASRLAPYLVLAVAGYVACWPPRIDDLTPRYLWLMLHAPARYGPERAHAFWWALAAVGVVWACGRVGGIRRALESGIAQYAGRISFALYILQHTVLNIFMLASPEVAMATAAAATAARVEAAIAAGTLADLMPVEEQQRPVVAMQHPWYLRCFFIGYDTPAQRTVCWLLGLCVIGSILVWVSDVFSRLVDAPIVRAARALETRAFVRDEEEDGDVLPVKN